MAVINCNDFCGHPWSLFVAIHLSHGNRTRNAVSVHAREPSPTGPSPKIALASQCNSQPAMLVLFCNPEVKRSSCLLCGITSSASCFAALLFSFRPAITRARHALMVPKLNASHGLCDLLRGDLHLANHCHMDKHADCTVIMFSPNRSLRQGPRKIQVGISFHLCLRCHICLELPAQLLSNGTVAKLPSKCLRLLLTFLHECIRCGGNLSRRPQGPTPLK